MNAATCIREMTTLRPIRTRAFTIIELLLVIAIMAIVAGLIVWGAGRASEQKKISRSQVERERIGTLIEGYKLKLGFYPPHDLNNPTNNTLVYELAGAVRVTTAPYSAANPGFKTPFGTLSSTEILSEFGMTNILNASDDPTEIKRFLKDLKPDQFVVTGPYGAKRLVVPVEDANGKRPNFWSYRAGIDDEAKKGMKNPETFDLWVDITARGQTRRIGNWKE